MGVTDDEFINSIISDPDDETRRLVYADWLEERGDARAEFLRLQLRRNKEGRERLHRSSRFQELREQLDADWVGVMTTLALPPEPFTFDFDADDLPCASSFEIRWSRGDLGQPGGLVTIRSQFRNPMPLSRDLLRDLRLLSQLNWSLGTCYYGKSDFTIYPFIAECPRRVPTPDITNEELLGRSGRGGSSQRVSGKTGSVRTRSGRCSSHTMMPSLMPTMTDRSCTLRCEST